MGQQVQNGVVRTNSTPTFGRVYFSISFPNPTNDCGYTVSVTLTNGPLNSSDPPPTPTDMLRYCRFGGILIHPNQLPKICTLDLGVAFLSSIRVPTKMYANVSVTERYRPRFSPFNTTRPHPIGTGRLTFILLPPGSSASTPMGQFPGTPNGTPGFITVNVRGGTMTISTRGDPPDKPQPPPLRTRPVLRAGIGSSHQPKPITVVNPPPFTTNSNGGPRGFFPHPATGQLPNGRPPKANLRQRR